MPTIPRHCDRRLLIVPLFCGFSPPIGAATASGRMVGVGVLAACSSSTGGGASSTWTTPSPRSTVSPTSSAASSTAADFALDAATRAKLDTIFDTQFTSLG